MSHLTLVVVLEKFPRYRIKELINNLKRKWSYKWEDWKHGIKTKDQSREYFGRRNLKMIKFDTVGKKMVERRRK